MIGLSNEKLDEKDIEIISCTRDVFNYQETIKKLNPKFKDSNALVKLRLPFLKGELREWFIREIKETEE